MTARSQRSSVTVQLMKRPWTSTNGQAPAERPGADSKRRRRATAADASTRAPHSDDLTHRRRSSRQPPPPSRGAPRKRETAKSLGVYDADRDILDQYLYEVSKTPLLTPQQEIAIARRVRAGDQEAMQELVKRNLRFVISVAKKYQNRGLPLTDLIGEGNVGLLTAARKFDPDQGVKFISYAVWWIRQAILAVARAPGPHRAGAAQPHRRPLAHRPDRRDAAAGTAARAHARRRSPTPPDCRSKWCSRWRRSTPATCGWTRRSIRTATAR